MMKDYSWNEEKNKRLKESRGISFEEVIFYLEKGDGLDVVNNPNQIRYRDQKMLVVRINKYVYLVPFVETEKGVFLKTIIPSRKATKIYLRGGKRNDKAQ